MKITQIL